MLNGDRKNSVEDLMACIESRGIPMDQQRLTLEGVQLQRGCNLSAYVILAGAEILMESTELDAMLALVGQDTSSWAAVDRIRQWSVWLATRGNAVATFHVDQQIVPFPGPPCPGSDASQGPIHFDLAAGDADADSFSHDNPDLELMFDDMSLAHQDEKSGAALTI